MTASSQIIPDELLRQEVPTLPNLKDSGYQEPLLFNVVCEPFLNIRVISSNFVVRSLGSTLDLTAVALVECQHAEVVVSLFKNLSQTIIDNTSYALAA